VKYMFLITSSLIAVWVSLGIMLATAMVSSSD
jgi:hypothetical protein